MSKVSGNQLENLIYGAKGISNIETNFFVEQRIEDCAVLPVESGEMLYTADFGPLVGKDPFIAGKIAALNAISDIYAMGGIPIYALVLLSLDRDLSTQEQEKILAGIYNACYEEKVKVAGGHTIYGAETLAGLSVMGKTRKNGVFRKGNCCVGDVILISKSLGTGIALRGYYHGLLGEHEYQKTMEILLKSNKVESSILDSPYIHAMTDITGFGFAGHLAEMLGETKGAKVYLNEIPYLKFVDTMCADVMINDYILNNYNYASEYHRIQMELDSIRKLLLFDPQTNGPIMICADKKIVPEIQGEGYFCVGEVTDNNQIDFIEG